MSDEFHDNIGLTQGSALTVYRGDRINQHEGCSREDDYADDLAILAERKHELQEALEEWNEVFTKHGLRMSLNKTEMVWVEKQGENLK